jgi:flagellin
MEVSPMRINQNIAAFNSYRNLSNTQNQLGSSLEKLSSGFRINRAADDAAGLTKSEGLRAEIRGTNQAVRNAQDGISLVQTAEGALNEVHSILQRMRELAVDANNTATTDGVAQQAEVDELLRELTAIGTRTEFAGQQVFDGTQRQFQVGANSADTLNVGIASLSSGSVGGTVGVDGDDNVEVQGSVDVSGITLTGGNAGAAINTLDEAIAAVSSQRSELGASQNRLEHTIANLQVAAENLSASESRIRDTDMAQEMVKFTRNQIMQQAGTAMLAQANQAPQSVLSLLR